MPTPHRTTEGEGERTCGHPAVIDLPPQSPTHRRANLINQQTKNQFYTSPKRAPKHHRCQQPTLHWTTGGGEAEETRYPFMLAAIDRVTTCKQNPQEGQLIKQPGSYRPPGWVGGGKQKEDAVKLVVRIGGGDQLQAIDQQH